MAQTVVLSPETQQKFAKRADYLEPASKLARDLSEAKPSELPIPHLKRPKHVLADQAWFWSEEWQRGEREVNAALKMGDYEVFDSMEELVADLNAHS
jgi:hypothetical protein